MTPSEETRGEIQEHPYIDKTFQLRMRPYIKILNEGEIKKYFEKVGIALEQLKKIGKKPGDVLKIMEDIGLCLSRTSGKNFTSDYQKIDLSKGRELWAIQLPCGGNLNLIRTSEGDIVLDTGYGYYFDDVNKMLYTLGIEGFTHVKKVICTHADADHCGAAGYLPAIPFMHPVTKQILDTGTRRFGSNHLNKELEWIFTTTINIFSKTNIPDIVDLCKTEPKKMRGLFPVIDEIDFGGLHFEIWESLGGHIAGQLFIYEKNEGLLFTSDTLINITSMTKSQKDYCSIANYLITSVNVDSETARIERQELLRIAKDIDEKLKKKGKRLHLCCGHGAVSILTNNGEMIFACKPKHYAA
ncbi:MAG TPA: MBL fold metallo-hydrolase [Methanocorpusculum sp.]|nr:MBL fold metallo-hydrolase [Methanocorpusculum sp.]